MRTILQIQLPTAKLKLRKQWPQPLRMIQSTLPFFAVSQKALIHVSFRTEHCCEISTRIFISSALNQMRRSSCTSFHKSICKFWCKIKRPLSSDIPKVSPFASRFSDVVYFSVFSFVIAVLRHPLPYLHTHIFLFF